MLIKRKKKRSSEVTVNLTALVDALTILLVFFMLQASVNSNVKIFDSSVFPSSDRAAQKDGANEMPVTHVEIETLNSIKVVVKQADKVMFETVSNMDKLNPLLKQLKNKYPDMKSLKIESSSEISYKDVIKVFDMAKSPESMDGTTTAEAKTLYEDVTLEDIFKG